MAAEEGARGSKELRSNANKVRVQPGESGVLETK